ncbi:unnamed protein product [Spodoptera exigua]|nr:unnamed protein product [Spodoptera exigua]
MSSDELHEEIVEIVEDDSFNFIAEDSDLTCTICQAEFLDPEDLNIHIDQVHKVKGTKKCYFCPEKYTDLMDFAEHFRDKHLANLFYCLYCLRSFKDEKEYKLHDKKHKRGTKSTYWCAMCSEKYGSLWDLRKHDLIYHEDNNEGYLIQNLLPYLSAVLKVKAVTALLSQHKPTVHTCMCCHYTTTELEDIITHSRNKKCKCYVCYMCTNVFKDKSSLQMHLEKVCEKRKPYGRVECPDCKVIYNSLVYSKHKKVCKIIKCSTCGTQYPSMYELSEHQSKDHPLSAELATCKFCWKHCVGTVALEKHMERAHKPYLHLYKYLCIYCKTPFKHPQKLFAHYFTTHRDLEPYTCTICSKTFRIRKRFTVHIKLQHKSVGFVEFDENYHVFFTEKKSEKPFIPKSLYGDENEKQTVVENTEDTDLTLLNMNSEISISETEGNQTETGLLVPRKRKKGTPKGRKKAQGTVTTLSSDDEPQEVSKKKTKSSRNTMTTSWKKKQQAINKKRFTCTICNKYCYTYQNYNHHISLHSKNEYKKCIKCSKVFRSKEKLNRHMNNEHSSSKLTDTLKTMLEKRKKGETMSDSLPMSEKFRRTIKKVECQDTGPVANIKQVEDGLSVQKFIENFMPETENRSESPIDNTVIVKMVSGIEKEPVIKMTKFNFKPLSEATKLAMPVKFKSNQFERTLATVRLVQAVSMYQEDNQDHDSQSYNEEIDRNDSIPEVAEEVMLEGTEETPNSSQIPHKIVIPKLPTMYKDLKIAHLHPQAPYYKIVPVKDVLKATEKADVKKDTSKNTIKLPDGTKLITTNPLAHLIDNKEIEKVMEPMKNRYYKYKERDLPKMLVEALSNLDKPLVRKKKVIGDNYSEASN